MSENFLESLGRYLDVQIAWCGDLWFSRLEVLGVHRSF